MFVRIAVTAHSFCKKKELVDELKTISTYLYLNNKNDSPSTQEVLDLLTNADYAIIGKEKIDKNIIDQCRHLKGISKYGVGLDNIDLDYLKEKNMYFFTEEGVNRLSVAEHTLGLMITLLHNQYQSSLSLQKGTWIKAGGFQLTGKTIGIIGIGHIGKELIRLLSPFHCKILVNDIIPLKEYYESVGAKECTKEELLALSDIVTIHTPLTPLTKNMINTQTLSLMKSSAFLINTARGGIVCEDDLVTSLNSNQIAGAGLDVFLEEPTVRLDVHSHPKIFCTPHIAGGTYEASLAMGRIALEGIKSFLNKK